jgi:hypothetical protein
LLERSDSHVFAQEQVAKTGNYDFIVKLLESHYLAYGAQEEIVKTGNRELLLKLYYHANVFESVKNGIKEVFHKNGWKFPK